jgi:hypothetical protein
VMAKSAYWRLVSRGPLECYRQELWILKCPDRCKTVSGRWMRALGRIKIHTSRSSIIWSIMLNIDDHRVRTHWTSSRSGTLAPWQHSLKNALAWGLMWTYNGQNTSQLVQQRTKPIRWRKWHGILYIPGWQKQSACSTDLRLSQNHLHEVVHLFDLVSWTCLVLDRHLQGNA